MATKPAVGTIKRYPVKQPQGEDRHQLVMVTGYGEEDGSVRGLVLGYADQAAHFGPDELVD